MASQQPRNHRHPQHERASGGAVSSSATSGSGSDGDVARNTMREVPLRESDQSKGQEQAISVSALEYTVFMKGYQLIEKQYGQLPEYRGISQRFQDQARVAHATNGCITWTSFFQPGQECSYMEALHEMTHLLATMMLETREDRDAMRDIVGLTYDAVNLRRTFEQLDLSQRLIIRKWEHLRDTLVASC